MNDEFSANDRTGDAAILAKNMWNNGVDRDEIADRLARRRYDKKTIECALDALPKGAPDNIVVRVPGTSPGRVALITCGLLFSGLGFMMLIVNRAMNGAAPILALGVLVAVGGGVLIQLGRS